MNQPLAKLALTLFIGISVHCRAMSIADYDHMTDSDKDRYVIALLKGAVKGLDARGESEQAKKLIALFADSSKSGGAPQFVNNLKLVRSINKDDNAEADKEVEQALALTLKQNAINVPVNYLLTINKDFKPSIPPKKN